MKTQVLISALLLALSATAAHAQAAPSTDPEYTYRVTVNSAGAYRVTVTSFNGPFHYRDVPLLPRNCSGNAGSPVTGAAEMLLFVQPSGPIHAEFHVPMTGGGSACEIFGEFDLKALDRPPSTNEVDPEMPPQGTHKPRMKELPDGINDLRAAEPVQIGRYLINWGDTTTLPASQATARRSGVCFFPYRYITLNAGPGTAEGTSNSLRRNGINGQLLAFDDLPALSPMTATTVNGLIGLPSGLSTIVLEADAPDYLAESSEYNNLRSVVVNVQGSCY